MTRDSKDLIVGLDIGTSKISSVIAQLGNDGRLEILAIASQESHGLKKGVVVNIEETVDSISRVIQEVELMAECKVREVFTGIAGSHIRSFNSNGVVAIKDKEVTRLDLERVVETARAMPIPADQEILHTLTQEFIIDGQDGVREPIGMSGKRLEVRVHIVTGAVSAAQNIIKSVRRCGLEVVDLVLQPLASSQATLSDDEKDLGVCLVDIGGGTTDLAIFTQGAIRHTAVIPIAGDQITNDIAMAMRTPTAEAEDIKLRYGVAMSALADAEDMIEVPGIGDRGPRRMSRQALADVIEPRVSELFELVQAELRRSGYEELLSSGIVLTGGSATMRGMADLAEDVFHLPSRIGAPEYHGNLADIVRHPRYATVVGLAMEGAAQRRRGQVARETRNVRQVLANMRSWFERNF
ncbi:MAG: cell division protein FtsA [Gammaproteobacteria bacterium]|jgi:cell division protein FtsA|nr:cell division protein FtsA [Gammaproteobacteria bacterium]MBU0771208.1 cell division protein FtsA [Gammaproteobacteria bacterium]MBU0855975.1 cell division protein FtsA [Gammaproteobacteria bacterium]MBU1848589.1 cell division protein FtsA [Gammaproteobacteria bacterium]